MSEESIKTKIQQDQIHFMKDGKKEESNILRFALSFINKEEKDKKQVLNNTEIIQVIKKVMKRNSEAYEQYLKAERNDLAEKEKQEMDLLKNYLPIEKNDEETMEIVKNMMQELNITSVKEMGKIMSTIKQKYGNEINMALVSKFIKTHLDS